MSYDKNDNIENNTDFCSRKHDRKNKKKFSSQQSDYSVLVK